MSGHPSAGVGGMIERIKRLLRLNRSNRAMHERTDALVVRSDKIEERVNRLVEYRTGHPIGDLIERRQAWNRAEHL